MALENPNIVCEHAIETVNNVLPDYAVSYIFSKLGTKDMAKTCILSKKWLHKWQSRMDLNFDMYDMFDHAQLASCYSFKNVVQNFTRIVDQSVMNYHGSKIRSIRVRLGFNILYDDDDDDGDYDIIDSLISLGVAKGVERIELLLFRGNDAGYIEHRLSKCDSLKYLHLQQCVLVPAMNFSRFSNLQTLVLQQITLKQDMFLGLFSICIYLVKLTLKECNFKSDINIVSAKLCQLAIIDDHRHYLRYLQWSHPLKITVDAVNLSSFDYSCPIRLSFIKAPRLLKFFWGAIQLQNIPYSFDLIASLHQLENLFLSMHHSHVGRLLTNLAPFQNVRQLELSIYGEYSYNMDYLQILGIVTASPNLQKLVLTISRPHLKHPNSIACEREEREHVGFFHNQLKYIALRGCIGHISAIEFVSHFLKNVNSLKQITFSPRDGFYIGAGKWSDSFDCSNCLGCELVCRKLKDEVKEQCQLVIL